MLTQCWRRVVQWNCSFFFRAHKSLSYWTDHQLFKLMTKVVPSWPPWPQGQNKPLHLKIDPPGPPGGVLEKFTQFFQKTSRFIYFCCLLPQSSTFLKYTIMVDQYQPFSSSPYKVLTFPLKNSNTKNVFTYQIFESLN